MAAIVFEQMQDSVLFHGSLISALKSINKDNLSYCEPKEKVEDAISSIAKSVKKVITRLNSSSKVEESLENQLHIHRRLHSVLLFMTLRSEGVLCAEADECYQSIVHVFPNIDLKFYIKLNMECSWSEYFIECSQQLPSHVLAAVLKLILCASKDSEDIKFYSWHLVLQAIIWKLCIMEDRSLLTSRELCNFQFPFCISSSFKLDDPTLSKSDQSSAKSQLLHSFVKVLNLLSDQNQSQGAATLRKIAIHGFKTLFNLLCKVTLRGGEHVKDAIRIHKLKSLVEQQEAVKDLARVPSSIPLHCYRTMSLDVDVVYLQFLLQGYVERVEKRLPYFSVIPGAETHIVEMRESMKSLLETQFVEPENNAYVKMLRNVVVYDFLHVSSATNIILSHSKNLETDGVLASLEKNVTRISSVETHPSFVDAIVACESPETKQRLLKILYKILAQGPISVYGSAIKNILSTRSYNEHFKLPDFESQLTQLGWNTLSLQQAESCLLPLFVQSPKVVLKFAISQALNQGEEGMTLIRILKHVPFVCTYQSNSETMPALLGELFLYFQGTNLTPLEMKNLPLVIKTITEVHREENILNSFDSYISSVITPHLVHESNLSLLLECFKISMKIMLESGAFEIDRSVLSSLVSKLSTLLNKYIEERDGKNKEVVLSAFSILEQYYAKSSAKEMNLLSDTEKDPIVKLYICKCQGTAREFDCADTHICHLFWTWCCITRNMKLFVDKMSTSEISPENLFNILVPLLSHFTSMEWVECACLLKEHFTLKCHQNNSSSACVWKLNKSETQLRSVIQCLIDCVYFLLRHNVADFNYIINCLTNTITFLLQNHETSPELQTEVFLSLCHLSQSTPVDSFSAISNLLMSIQKNISTRCKEDESLARDCVLLLLEGAKSLPDSKATGALTGNLKKGL